jgi:hypothetical protein
VAGHHHARVGVARFHLRDGRGGSAGKHTVRASVQWDRTLAVAEARLTVYRERTAR